MAIFKNAFSIPRAEGVTDQQAALSFGGRFFDELLGSLPDLFMPVIQRQLGLSLTQVSALPQLLFYVAAFVEPITASLADIWRRHRLMAWGAAGMAVALILLGVAPAFWALALAYILFGVTSGPLAHTGDVAVVEAYPNAPDQAFARSTIFDTIGGMLGPLLAALILGAGLPWQWTLYLVAGIGFVYALLLLRIGLPLPKGKDGEEKRGTLATIRDNVRTVLSHSAARRWLLFLFFFDLLETPFLLQTIWLRNDVGFSQSLIAIYVAAEMGVSLVSLLTLDWLRRRFSSRQILAAAIVGVAILVPLWILIPGIWTKFALMIPMDFFFVFFWPLAKGESLASVPGRAGAITALQSLFGLLPIPLLFGALADAVGLPQAMLGAHVAAAICVGLMVWLLPASPQTKENT